MSLRRSKVVITLLLVLGAVVALAAPACSSSNAGPRLYVGCAQNSDCDTGLICALGQLCRPQCKTPADCPGQGDACLTDSMMHAVCQPAKIYNSPCDKPGDCMPPLACATDYRCRNLCATSADCNVGMAKDRVCAQDMNGVNYCATMSEVTTSASGVSTLTTPPAPGHSSIPVQEPDASITAQPDAGGKDGTGPGTDGMMMMTGGDSGTDGSSGGDSSMMATCAAPCGVGKQCVSGMCVPCGASNQPCCAGSICNTSLTCNSSQTCACGDPGEACCGGNMCNNGVTCVSGTCACGSAHNACCPATDGGAASCTSPLQCAGVDCSCLVACSGGMVQDTTGALYTAPTTYVPDTMGTGGKFKATNFAYSQSGYLGCAVTSDGKLWCWTTNNSNPYGELGNGNTMPPTSMVPTPVLQSAATPLTNIANVFVDNYSGYTACAIDTNGAAWCWGYGGPGYGLLGTGNTNNSPYAVPVQYMGSQLTGVAQMSVTNDHVCALKTDGELICWGNNNSGQIGIGPSAPMTVLNPTLVSNLGTNVSSVSVGGSATCATDTQGYVWCWGSNSNGILGNGLASSTGNAYVPAKVEIGDAGTQFGGASRVEVLYYGESACALKQADGSIWCWGNYSGPSGTQPNGYFPVQYAEQMVAITGVFKFCANQTYYSNSVDFIDSHGVFHNAGSGSGQQVSCP